MTLLSRQAQLKISAVMLGLVIALIFSELILHVYAKNIVSKEKMDDGLIQQDTKLGWRLKPNWHGRHHHFDYDVNYQVDLFGFRASSRSRPNSPKPIIFVGDSFTFGIGVNDDETFVARLNVDSDIEYINAGVPGYSPEQIALRAEELAVRYRPRLLVFVVYLGNDLVDIGYEFPAQAAYGKPFAEIDSSGHWQLRNSPVLRPRKPADFDSGNFASRLLVPGSRGFLSNLKLVQLVEAIHGGEIDTKKLTRSFQLFDGQLERLRAEVNSRMLLMLMPGASASASPGSLEARYQATVRDHIVAFAASRKLSTLDLTSALIDPQGIYYYPHDGHLTPKGHEVVAKQLGSFFVTHHER